MPTGPSHEKQPLLYDHRVRTEGGRALPAVPGDTRKVLTQPRGGDECQHLPHRSAAGAAHGAGDDPGRRVGQHPVLRLVTRGREPCHSWIVAWVAQRGCGQSGDHIHRSSSSWTTSPRTDTSRSLTNAHCPSPGNASSTASSPTWRYSTSRRPRQHRGRNPLQDRAIAAEGYRWRRQNLCAAGLLLDGEHADTGG